MLRPEAIAGARTRSPRPSGPLLGGGQRDAPQLQPVEPRRGVEPHHPRKPRIHHRRHTLDRDGGLGHIRRQHDPPARACPQRSVLLRARQVAIERNNVERLCGRHNREPVAGAANLLHARQKDEDVAGGLAQRLHRGRLDRMLQLPLFGTAEVLDGHREEPAFGEDDRRVAEKGRHGAGVERRRHHDDAEVGARLPLQLASERERQVGREVPLVELVEDEGVDALQEGVIEEHPDEQPLGHHKQPCLRGGPPFVPDVEAHLVAERPALLAGNAGGARTGCHAPRLEHDQPLALLERTRNGGRHPRRLAGAGQCLHHHIPPRRVVGQDLGEDKVDGKREHRTAFRPPEAQSSRATKPRESPQSPRAAPECEPGPRP